MFHLVLRRTGAAVAELPDFVRLGLLLLLGRRPDEPTARAELVEVRQATAERVRSFYRVFSTTLGADEIESLATLTLALADGLFVAAEVDRLDHRATSTSSPPRCSAQPEGSDAADEAGAARRSRTTEPVPCWPVDGEGGA